MANYGLEQIQRASQVQVQRMTQKQIQALNMLAMSSQDLRDEIYKAAEENPALEVVRDPVSDGAENIRKVSKGPVDYTHLSSSSASGEEKAEHFQQMLESEPDTRETLQEHLLFQLNVMHLTENEREVCKKLIHNLDGNGFHILAPVSLLDSSVPAQTQNLLAKCMDLVQRMDPTGTCCSNISESLYVQAKIRGDASDLVLFLLRGHLDFLDPPVPAKVIRRIQQFCEEQKKMSFAPSSQTYPDSENLTSDDIEKALSFIRSLNPHPAQNFGTETLQYVRPDVYIEKTQLHVDADDKIKGFVRAPDGTVYSVRLSSDSVPEVAVARDFSETVAGGSSAEKNGEVFVKKQTAAAAAFLENLKYRNDIIINACGALVRCQSGFFEKGPGNLAPLSQKQLASEIGVHESTISRMAGSKYIQCAWGLFPIKYFFTNAVPAAAAGENTVSNASEPAAAQASKESALFAIKKILESRPAGLKPLSDQKLADALEEQGIKIARRTVAKYRAELNIESSYSR